MKKRIRRGGSRDLTSWLRLRRLVSDRLRRRSMRVLALLGTPLPRSLVVAMVLATVPTADVPRGEAGEDVDVSCPDHPFLAVDVPVADISSVQFERDDILGGRLRQTQVELRYRCARYVAGVGDGDADAVQHVPKCRGATSDALDRYISHREARIGQAKAELVLHRFVEIVEVTYIRLPCIWVVGVLQFCRIGNIREGVVALLVGDGVGKFSGGVHVTPEDVDDTVPSFLTWVVRSEDCSHVGVISERQDVNSSTVRDNDSSTNRLSLSAPSAAHNCDLRQFSSLVRWDILDQSVIALLRCSGLDCV
ncbi:putative beta-glucosidase [Hortaea werneckii]|nr:putative beta-glucosidase [Hortaea werneckii]